MREKLIETLESLGYDVYLQGSLTEGEDYPASFFTFWQFQGNENHYDNDAVSCDLGYWVYFYSTDPALTETVPRQARKKLKEQGFILGHAPFDLSCDEPSHTGKVMTIYFIENYKEEQK